MLCRSRCKLNDTLRQGISNVSHRKFLCTQIAVRDDEDALYPPVKPKWPPGKWDDMDRTQAWRTHSEMEKVAGLRSVQQRIDHLTEKKYKIWHFPVVQDLPRLLEFQQDKTKTHIVNSLPATYNTIDVERELEMVKPLVIDAILLERLYREPRRVNDRLYEYTRTQRLVRQILDILLLQFGTDHEHLVRTQVDQNVRVEAFWDKYGIKRSPPEEKPKDPNFKLPNYRRLQSRYIADFQIRIEEPLPEFVPHDDRLCTEGAYPSVNYEMAYLGQSHSKTQQTCVPGFHNGDPCEFGLLSVQLTATERLRKFQSNFGATHTRANQIGLGLSSSFVGLVAQAYYQGFNTMQDITYPLTTQTIVTDGQTFSFFTYQLNTMHLWRSDEVNPLRNICWHSEEAKLYSAVEDGEVKDFNDDVLRQIIKFFLLKPVGRGIELKPSLPKDDTYLPVDSTAHIPYLQEEVVEEEKILYDES